MALTPLAWSAVIFGFCLFGVGLTATYLRVLDLEAALHALEQKRWRDDSRNRFVRLER